MLSAVRFAHRIEFLELRAGLPIGELPVDGRPPRVALALQRLHSPLQARRVADRAREAAALDDADLDLGPTLASCRAWACGGTPGWTGCAGLAAAGRSHRARRRCGC